MALPIHSHTTTPLMPLSALTSAVVPVGSIPGPVEREATVGRLVEKKVIWDAASWMYCGRDRVNE